MEHAASPAIGADGLAEREFRSSILERVNDAIIGIDNAGLVTYLNAAAARQYRVSVADSVGRPLSHLYRYEWVDPRDEARSAQALAEHRFWRGENRHMLRDGRVLHVDSSVSVLQDASGAVVGLVAIIRDISDAKRAASALRESDERQRMALEAADLGVWNHDIPAGLVELDERARTHYGVDRHAVDVEALLARIHPDDRAALQHAIAAALDPCAKAPVKAEYRVVAPDGGVRWLSVNGHVHFIHAGADERPAKGIGTTRDITEQKRAEEVLREADRRKDEFLAILAHELRNPLAPIRTAVAVLGAPDLPAPVADRSRAVIERQVAHMTRLIDDLLDVSRLSRGLMTLQRQTLRLDQVLDAALETARPLIDERGHRIEQQRAPAAVHVHGDLTRLSQVFANLLNNAAKYTPRGGTISLAVTAGDRAVDVRVVDTGQGIAPDRIDDIFALFAQGSGAHASSVGGLGVGLALATRLVELHGGTIRASSPGLGQGAAFTVTLPIVDGLRDTVAADAPMARDLGRRVLVVDDSPDAADMTAILLEAAGCVARAAYSGESAIAEVQTFAPDVVLLDLGMPGLDGLETCRAMRALAPDAPVFIVALTGWGQDEDRRRTQAAGFDAHLVKPVAPDALLALIESAPKPPPGR